MSAVNPPDSPPAAPVISEGLATKMGKWGTALLAVVAAFGPLLDGFGTQDSKWFATLAAAVGIATIIGRMLQSAAALRDAPSPTQVPPVVDDAGDDVALSDEVPPTVDEARPMYPGDPPLS
jgi:hypothetical protein